MRAAVKAGRSPDGIVWYLAGMSAAQRITAMAYARCASTPEARSRHVKRARKANWQLIEDMRMIGGSL